MDWMYAPNGHEKIRVIEFGKKGCVACEAVTKTIQARLNKLGIEDQVEFINYDLSQFPQEGLIMAAMHDIPLDTVPSVVIAGKEGFWKKTTSYAPVGSKERSDLIRPQEIEEQLIARAREYGLKIPTSE